MFLLGNNITRDANKPSKYKTLFEVNANRENQQDATEQMYIIERLSQHVLGTIMPIIRRTKL
jgi:hypothetical protein